MRRLALICLALACGSGEIPGRIELVVYENDSAWAFIVVTPKGKWVYTPRFKRLFLNVYQIESWGFFALTDNGKFFFDTKGDSLGPFDRAVFAQEGRGVALGRGLKTTLLVGGDTLSLPAPVLDPGRVPYTFLVSEGAEHWWAWCVREGKAVLFADGEEVDTFNPDSVRWFPDPRRHVARGGWFLLYRGEVYLNGQHLPKALGAAVSDSGWLVVEEDGDIILSGKKVGFLNLKGASVEDVDLRGRRYAILLSKGKKHWVYDGRLSGPFQFDTADFLGFRATARGWALAWASGDTLVVAEPGKFRKFGPYEGLRYTTSLDVTQGGLWLAEVVKKGEELALIDGREIPCPHPVFTLGNIPFSWKVNEQEHKAVLYYNGKAYGPFPDHVAGPMGEPDAPYIVRVNREKGTPERVYFLE